VTVASHILPAQEGIRASRPASINEFDGGSRFKLGQTVMTPGIAELVARVP
jgi:hypothetical protein